MPSLHQKHLGSYYTPEHVVQSLVRWVVRSPMDRMLDPACGDGRFLAAHPNSVGVERDAAAAAIVHRRTPGLLAHEGDFFAWAANARQRFDCAAGNPPFIRYQRFNGGVRETALRLCKRHGAKFNSLSSSWAPFLVAAAALLKPGGRMGFVVPAEIGHAPYARPLVEYLTANFEIVHVVAVRRKLFPQLSEDCWLLYCQGRGGRSSCFRFSALEQFDYAPDPPRAFNLVRVGEWGDWNFRMRPLLLPAPLRDLYRAVAASPDARRLRSVARVGIGYVTGDNHFFHLRPSHARELGVPDCFLHPAVRNGKYLTGRAITQATVDAWKQKDEPVLLLRLKAQDVLPPAVRRYLDSSAGMRAREAYKCRMRKPWWAVPDVRVPDAFLAYMSNSGAALVANRAGCVGTNSVHVVELTGAPAISALQQLWKQSLTQLSCEIEGHPLGGGLLKLEPGEASRVLLSRARFSGREHDLIGLGIEIMRRWRHYGE